MCTSSCLDLDASSWSCFNCRRRSVKAVTLITEMPKQSQSIQATRTKRGCGAVAVPKPRGAEQTNVGRVCVSQISVTAFHSWKFCLKARRVRFPLPGLGTAAQRSGRQRGLDRQRNTPQHKGLEEFGTTFNLNFQRLCCHEA